MVCNSRAGGSGFQVAGLGDSPHARVQFREKRRIVLVRERNRTLAVIPGVGLRSFRAAWHCKLPTGGRLALA
jgi:hypothetical protein